MDDIFQKDSVSLGSIMVKQVNMYFGKEPNFESIYDLPCHTLLTVIAIPGSLGNTTDIKSKYCSSMFY